MRSVDLTVVQLVSNLACMLAKGYQTDYQELLLKLSREDRRKQGASPKVMDADDIPNWQDPNWVSSYRQISAYSTWRLA